MRAGIIDEGEFVKVPWPRRHHGIISSRTGREECSGRISCHWDNAPGPPAAELLVWITSVSCKFSRVVVITRVVKVVAAVKVVRIIAE